MPRPAVRSFRLPAAAGIFTVTATDGTGTTASERVRVAAGRIVSVGRMAGDTPSLSAPSSRRCLR